MLRYIFITGGVVSSLGKGLASASLGALLQAHGYRVRLRKMDPYLNIDPGTMSPLQHGEVFVTDDGAETDLDIGHYERFTGVPACRSDSMTAGKIYEKLLQKERRGDYLGRTVQVIPHVTDLIKEAMAAETEDLDFILCEIGGTVGDIEGLPFYESIRQLRHELGRLRVLCMHLTLVPYIAAAKELKTKPTQHSVKELRSIGIHPDILLCRCDRDLPESEREKIALFCNMASDAVIPMIDVKNIYSAPLALHRYGLDRVVLTHFGLEAPLTVPLDPWHRLVHAVQHRTGELTIMIVGKYVKGGDAYKSLEEAFEHAAVGCGVQLHLRWVNARQLKEENLEDRLKGADGILVPGGFGQDGIEGKILAIRYARERGIPFFGICLGMQLAVIEAVRHLLSRPEASSTEFGPTPDPVVVALTEWVREHTVEKRNLEDQLGGTMRLGGYPCRIEPGSLAESVYGCGEIRERHRHRYEVHRSCLPDLARVGLVVSGYSPYGQLPEIVEFRDHPWFMAVQFHPELISSPFHPHPLFVHFLRAAQKKKAEVH